MDVRTSQADSNSDDPEIDRINLRISPPFLEVVDETWRERGFNSRSEFIRYALRNSVNHSEGAGVSKDLAISEAQFNEGEAVASEAVRGQYETDDGWDWAFSPRAETQLSQHPSNAQQRTIDKLDDVMTSEWRDLGDFLDPLQNSPFQKLRVGDYRVGCRLMCNSQMLRVENIRKREGAYKGGA